MKTNPRRGPRFAFDFEMPEFSKKETCVLYTLVGTVALGAITLVAKIAINLK